MSILPTCIYLHSVYTDCPQRLKEGSGSSVTGVTDGCEPPCGCRRSDPGPLEERPVLSHLSSPVTCLISFWLPFVSPFFRLVLKAISPIYGYCHFMTADLAPLFLISFFLPQTFSSVPFHEAPFHLPFASKALALTMQSVPS